MKKNKKSISIKLNIKLKLFLALIAIIILILIGLIIISFKEETTALTKYKSDYISFVYDNNFEVVEEDNYIALQSKDKSSTVVIKKIDYTSNAKNKNQYDIASSLSYQVIEDEKDYIEIYNSQEKVNDINRYYSLYENYEKGKQIEVVSIFDDQYIYVVIYSAKSEEFDLYTESISLIIDSIEV